MTARILYIAPDWPLSPNFRGGASAIYHEQFASLHALGHELHLWHFATERKRALFDEFVAGDAAVWSRVQSQSAGVTITTLPRRPSLADRLHHAIVNRLSADRYWPHLHDAAAALQRLLTAIEPDLIWAQHLQAAIVATSQTAVPVVYAHHDWLYRVKALRNEERENARLRRLEERVARQATAVTSGNASECRQLQALGARHVACIPVAYEPAPVNLDPLPDDVRLVHLGGLATTATRVGLERFFGRVWPALGDERLPFYCIGDVTAAGPRLRSQLADAITPGYVPDLTAVLRPFDIHVIPWEHNTGQRTRLPVAFNFAQVVVAVRAGVAGFPEAIDGDNCRLVDTIDDLAPAIKALLADPGERQRLGRAARHTFEQSFTRRALLPRYKALVTAVTTHSVDALSLN